MKSAIPLVKWETTMAVSRGHLSTGFLALLPTLLGFVWLVSKAQWYWTHRPDMQFGWIVLMLSVFVIWDQWAKRPEPIWQAGWPFYVCGAIGLSILAVMQVYQAAFGLM